VGAPKDTKGSGRPAFRPAKLVLHGLSRRPTFIQPTAIHALPVSELVQDAHHHLSSLYDVADAVAAAAANTSKSSSGFLSPLTDTLEDVLKNIQDQLDRLHVPYSYGYSIIALTILVKAVTFPLTKKQVESSLAVQSLKPRIDMIKARYGDNKDKVQKETQLLYNQAGVNPLAGCLPSIATIPIFIGLYRSLTNVANEGLLDTQGFYWIPTLAGPTTMAANRAGSGTAWLWPLVDGHPPIGWDAASHYLVLPVLLVICQYISSAVVTPPIDPNAENAGQQKVLYALLPTMIGWFALNVPSGLGLYYLTNTAVTTAIQVWLRKLGGADVKVNDLGPITKTATARRLGPVATEEEVWNPRPFLSAEAAAASTAAAGEGGAGVEQQPEGAAAATTAAAGAQSSNGSSSSSGFPTVQRYAKRKKLVPVAMAGSEA